MRLSKKGWNNVLIFGVLFIVFIVNFQQELSLSSSTQRETIVPTQFNILEIETPDYTITRVGRHWQSTPNIGITNDQLQRIINNWQNVLLDSATDARHPIASFSIYIYVAEQAEPLIITLHQQQDDSYILEINKQRFLALPTDKLGLFIGR